MLCIDKTRIADYFINQNEWNKFYVSVILCQVKMQLKWSVYLQHILLFSKS